MDRAAACPEHVHLPFTSRSSCLQTTQRGKHDPWENFAYNCVFRIREKKNFVKPSKPLNPNPKP